MTAPLVIHVPGEPVAKGRPKFTRKGFAFTPEKTRVAERTIASFAQEAMGGRPLFDGPLAVVIDCAFLWRKSAPKKLRLNPLGRHRAARPDLDNLYKCVDALNGVVWTDDALIVNALVRKFYSDKPGTTIYVWPIAEFDLLSLLQQGAIAA